MKRLLIALTAALFAVTAQAGDYEIGKTYTAQIDTFAGSTKENCNQLNQLALADRDTAAVAEMINNDEAIIIPKGSKVIITHAGWDAGFNGIYGVRVAEHSKTVYMSRIFINSLQ
jgi:hypothetical protein